MKQGTEIKMLDHGYLKLVNWMGGDEDIIESARMSTGRGFLGWEDSWLLRHPEQRDKYLIDVGAGWDVTTNKDKAWRGTYEAAIARGDSTWTDFQPENAVRVPGDKHLLQFLYENRHDTPFEMVELVVEVQAPIMVFREWQRHRTQSYNEMSARYIQMPNLHYIPSVERIVAASRTHRNKQQGGGGELKLTPRIKALEEAMASQVGRPADFSEEQIAAHVRTLLHEEQQSVFQLYEELLGMGIAPEVARLDTPVARYSRMRAKTDLRNWLAFLTLRSDANAQWEIRQFAYGLGYFLSRLFPRTWALWLDADRKKPQIDKNGFILAEAA